VGRDAPLLQRLLHRASRRMFAQEIASLEVLAHNPRFSLVHLASKASASCPAAAIGRGSWCRAPG